MKKGYKTTEFWALAAGGAVTLVNSAFGLNIPQEGIVSLAVMVAGYALSRGFAKAGAGPSA